MFFKKKPYKLTFYTNDQSVFTNCKPKGTIDNTEWLRSLKSTFKHYDQNTNSEWDVPTVKNCPGINYFMNEGLKFSLWRDVKIRVNPDGIIEPLPTATPEDSMPTFGQHEPDQYKFLYSSDTAPFKLNNPWLAVCDSDIKFLFVESHYSTNIFRDNHMYLPPGLVDYKYQYSTNVHVLTKKQQQPYEIYLPYGTPLFTIHALTERDIDVDYKLVSDAELNNLAQHFPKCPMRKYYEYMKKFKSPHNN